MAGPQNKSRTYQQIESTAGFYEPYIYELLPRFSNFKAETDSLAGDYTPLSSVSVKSPKDAKMFVVGILPPTSNVTGRLLDRSASISSITGQATNEAAVASMPADPPSPAFYEELVRRANRMGVKPEDLAVVFNGESGMNPHAPPLRKGKTVAKGLNGMTEYVALSEKVGMPKEIWDNFENLSGTEQLAWIEKCMSPCKGKDALALYEQNLGGYNNPQPESGTIGQIFYVSPSWVGDHRGRKDPQWQNPALRLDHQYTSYDQNKPLDYDKDGCISQNDMSIHVEKMGKGVREDLIKLAKDKVGDSTDAEFSADALTGQALKDSWSGKGSANAKKAQKQQQDIANADLNLSGLGRALVEKQQAMIKATLDAIELMKNTPPLRMLVNPTSFKVASEKIIADGNRSRSQFIIEHWGEQQDKIEASGKLAGFFAADMVGKADVPTSSNTTPNTVGTYPGLTRTARHYSRSWQNFLSLFMIYKSNGGLYLQDFYEASHSKNTDAMNLSVVGSVYIYYDNTLYIGSFDNFTITEADTAPFTVEYSFSFSVRATFLLDSVDDPKFTYGNARLFDSSAAVPTTTGIPPTVSPSQEPTPDTPWSESAQKFSDDLEKQGEVVHHEKMNVFDTPWLDDKGNFKVPKNKPGQNMRINKKG